ncbi:MAG: hypothetical protein E7666_07865 [Ruminococcaceae bacterium]|nr:hypothetical protein [Oscillospiraceae bacterium]
MGYLFLSLALFAGAAKGFCGKKISGFAQNTTSAVLLNLFRMLLCVAFSTLLLFVMGDATALVLTKQVVIASAVSGIATALFVVSWLLAVRKSAYMMLDVFLMLGTLIPMLLSLFIFSEPIGIRQWIGFGVLLVAAYIMCSYNNSIKPALTPSSFFLLILCGAANGIADASQKVFVRTAPDVPISIFNLYTYIIAALALALFFVLSPNKERVGFQKGHTRVALVYLLMMAVALTANSYFKTTAALYLDSARLYPINQAASLILSTLMATFFFKERLTAKAGVGIVLSFVALMLTNL